MFASSSPLAVSSTRAMGDDSPGTAPEIQAASRVRSGQSSRRAGGRYLLADRASGSGTPGLGTGSSFTRVNELVR